MNKIDIKNILFNSHGKLNPRASKREWWQHKNLVHIFNDIEKQSSFLSNANFSEKIYCYLHDIQEKPKCNKCFSELKFNQNIKAYKKYCSIRCSLSSKESKEKRKQTNLKKYGTETPCENQEIQSRVLETKKKKYGSSSYNNRQKAQETCIEKYGAEHYKKSKQYQESLKDHQLFTRDFLIKEHHKNKKSYSQIGNETGYSNCTVSRHSKKHNIETKWFYHSTGQKEISEYVKSLGVKCVENYRHPPHKEIDIFVPEYNLGIEYNGLYWHSYNKKETQEEKNKHKNKSLWFLEHGIQLLQIFENEWNDPHKRDIWQSVIKSKIGIFNTKIFARNCKIKEVDQKDEKEFLNMFHLQGYRPSSVCFGIYHQNQLLSLISMGKPRFNVRYDYEIIRYCSKPDFRIVGGFSKLLNHFIRNYSRNIITYADLRYSFGDVYQRCGFKEVRKTEPNYFYFNNNNYKNTIPRYKAQKQRLPRLLNNYDDNLTESENMFKNGYRRVWDCGNILLEYRG
jgi:hypothetical protein